MNEPWEPRNIVGRSKEGGKLARQGGKVGEPKRIGDTPTTFGFRRSLDAHTLIREYFAKQLCRLKPDVWRSANWRLYEHLKNNSEVLPNTLPGAIPLCHAVRHACQADRHQQAFVEVYEPRILRPGDYFLTDKLGAFATDLETLSNFFVVPWIECATSLSDELKARIFNIAGYRLRAVGPWQHALSALLKAYALDRQLAKNRSKKHFLAPSTDAAQLAMLHTHIGDLGKALVWARDSVNLAKRSGIQSQLISSSVLGQVWHKLGKLRKARDAFTEAKASQRRASGEPPILHSTPAFRHYELLLDLGDFIETVQRARQALRIDRRRPRPLDLGLHHFSLARAWLHLGKHKQAESNMSTAIAHLQATRRHDDICRGLIGRAEFYRITKRADLAWADLTQAERIAQDDGMYLFLADHHLEAARLCLFEFEVTQSKERITRAELYLYRVKPLIKKIGYGRRQPDYELVAARLALLQDRRNQARAHIDAARKWITPVGRHSNGFKWHLGMI